MPHQPAYFPPQTPPDLWADTVRQATLRNAGGVEASADPGLADLPRIAALLCGVPAAGIALIDGPELRFVAQVGFDGREPMLAASICRQTIESDGWLAVPDIAADPRFRASLLTASQPFLTFAAGTLLFARDGLPLGMVVIAGTAADQPGDGHRPALELVARQAAAALERNSTIGRLEATLGSTPQAMVTVDRDFRITYANPTIHATFGFDDGTLVGRSVWDVAEPIRETDFALRCRRAMADGNPDHFEFFSGERWFDVGFYPSPHGLNIYAQDITASRKSKERLLLLEAAVSRASDLILITDAAPLREPGPRIVFANDAFHRRTGFTADDIIGHSPRMLQGPRTDRSELERISTALEAFRPVRAELINYSKDGTAFWIELDIAPIFDNTGICTNFVAIERDISDRKSEDVLQRAKTRILDFVLMDSEFDTILLQLSLTFDEYFPLLKSSILVVGPDGRHFDHAISAHLPSEYLDIVKDWAIGPESGSCGMAIHRCRSVVITDVEAGLPGTEHRDVLLQFGLRACWSTPVCDTHGTMLATFAVYRDRPGGPDDREYELVARFTQLIALAIERRRHDNALRDSNARFEQLAEHIDEVFWIINPATREVIYLSPAYEKIWGRRPEEVYGDPGSWLAALQPDDGAAGGRAFNGESMVSEYSIVRPDGAVRWIQDRAFRVMEREGTAPRLVGVAKDVSDTRIAQLRMAESEERFRIVAQVCADVVWDFDLETDKVWWNDGMLAVFGYSTAELPPGLSSWSDHIHPDDKARVVARFNASVSGTDELWSDEFRFVRADGTSAQVVDRGYFFRNASGRALRMVGSMVDVTEQHQLEEQLRQSQRLESIGLLTGGIAHDFNNLLTVILGNAELLQESLAQTPDLRELAEMTRAAAERGAMLTSRLLAFARRQPLDPKVTDIAALIHGMEGMLRRTLGGNIEVDLFAAAGLWTSEIDATQLESGLLNLSINARDAMPDGGELHIGAENIEFSGDGEIDADIPAGHFVVIAVSDTGCGMDEATVASAFDPFFTTKDVGKGSGLGLSMVYGFIKQSNGHVRIQSEPGRGTTVRLYLPRSFEPAHDTPERGDVVPAMGAESLLLVEDDDLVRAHVKAQLESLGYRVTAAANGREAMTVLDGPGVFDLLFTDVVMRGGVDGPAVADYARLVRQDIPVVFSSGYTEQSFAPKETLSRLLHFLPKPYGKAELAATVRAALDRPVAMPVDG